MLHTPVPGSGFTPRQANAPHVDSIAAINIVKDFHTEHGTRRVLDGISFEVRPGERMAVLGRNGAGKSTLIKVLSGLELPSSGSVYRGLKMSWPIALGGGFEGGMTGYDNVRFLCEIYGAPLKKTLAFVDEFTELSEQLYTAVRFYSDGMRARLAFALSLAIDFDCYLIDEVILVGDQRFQEKCRYELFERRKDRALIVAIHDTNFVREHCTSALILKAGRARLFHDVELATNIYSTL